MRTAAGGAKVPRLLIVYRSHCGENLKSRPSYYSKLLALNSLLRAAEAMTEPPEMVFVNDGPMPTALTDIMYGAGRVVPVSAGSNRESLRASVSIAMRLAIHLDSSGSDALVWFAEDDYLYAPSSLQQLVEAASVLQHGDYFSLYGSFALNPSGGGRHALERPEPRSTGDPDAFDIDGTRWYRAISTTSTFAVRAGVLREDWRLLRMCPYAGGAWDHATCLTYQGYQPFPWPEVRRDLLPVSVRPVREWPRSLARGLVRAGCNLRSLRRPERRRVILCADPEPITHLELPYLAAGWDWAQLADETTQWAAASRAAGDVTSRSSKGP